MKNIYKENYGTEIYEEFYNFIDKKVDEVLKKLESSYYENEFFDLENGYQIWIGNILEEASEETGLQVECYDLQVEIQTDLESDFRYLEDEIKYHNENVK